MIDNDEQILIEQEVQIKKENKERLQWQKFLKIAKIVLIFGIILFFIWGVMFFRAKQKVFYSAKIYDKVVSEVERCKVYVSYSSGDYMEQEYCKNFLVKFRLLVEKINQ